MRTTNIHASTVEEGDFIIVDGVLKHVEGVRDNGRMNGVWLQFTDGHDRFYDNDDIVRLKSKEKEST